MPRSWPLFFLLSVFSLLLLGCGGDKTNGDAVTDSAEVETAVPTSTTDAIEPTKTAEPEPEILDLDIKGFLFRPVTVTVKVGTTVRWTNLDDIQHFVTNGTPDHIEDHFDSGPFVQDEQFTYTFTEPGQYQYFCQRHPHMQATIIVEK